jgi:hypothetical protein
MRKSPSVRCARATGAQKLTISHQPRRVIAGHRLTRRVPETTRAADQPVRHDRGLNPLAEADRALLTAISDPRWMIEGVRNRDLVAVLYPTVTEDPAERR